MRNRRPHDTRAVERLRFAIDCLPVGTREAMLTGVLGAERVITGAYVDEGGGMCPMLAAHRQGSCIDGLSFARSWDRFTRTGSGSRPVTERELGMLVAQLEGSLAAEQGMALDEAIREHRVLCARKRRREGVRRYVLPEAADPRGTILARRLRPARNGRELAGAHS
jgi:hypothetical protein